MARQFMRLAIQRDTFCITFVIHRMRAKPRCFSPVSRFLPVKEQGQSCVCVLYTWWLSFTGYRGHFIRLWLWTFFRRRCHSDGDEYETNLWITEFNTPLCWSWIHSKESRVSWLTRKKLVVSPGSFISQFLYMWEHIVDFITFRRNHINIHICSRNTHMLQVKCLITLLVQICPFTWTQSWTSESKTAMGKRETVPRSTNLSIHIGRGNYV